MKTNPDARIRQARTAVSKWIRPISARVRCFTTCCSVLALVWIMPAPLAAAAAIPEAPTILATQDLRVWTQQVPISGSQLQEMALAKQLSSDEELYPFSGKSVVGLAVTGFVQFKSERSIVRIVMVDEQLDEYLVYETYPLLASATVFPIRDACQETCLLPLTVPSY